MFEQQVAKVDSVTDQGCCRVCVLPGKYKSPGLLGKPHLWDVTHLFSVGQRSSSGSSPCQQMPLLTTNTTTHTQATHMHTNINTSMCPHTRHHLKSQKMVIGWYHRFFFSLSWSQKNSSIGKEGSDDGIHGAQLTYNTPRVGISLTHECWINTIRGFLRGIFSFFVCHNLFWAVAKCQNELRIEKYVNLLAFS